MRTLSLVTFLMACNPHQGIVERNEHSSTPEIEPHTPALGGVEININDLPQSEDCGDIDTAWTTWEDEPSGAGFSYPPVMHQSVCPDWSGMILHNSTSLDNQTCSSADSATSSLSASLIVDERALAGITLQEYMNKWSEYPITWTTVDGYEAANIYIEDGYPSGSDIEYSVTYVDVDGVLWELYVRLQDHGDRPDLATAFDSGAIECSFHVE